jgi:thiol-disulfide isomerase/thioredoxin
MAPVSQPRSAGVTGLLFWALIIVLLAGAVLVRLVGDDVSVATVVATTEAPAQVTDDETSAAKAASGPLRQGVVAPDFTLADLDGRPIRLSDWQGRPVLINFWATWCGPCQVEMPTIQAAYDAHQKDGLVVLAVAVDDSAKNVRSFFEKRDLTLQPLMDDGTVSSIYQVFGLPTSYFVGADGKITAVHTGLLTEDKIEQYLARNQ